MKEIDEKILKFGKENKMDKLLEGVIMKVADEGLKGFKQVGDTFTKNYVKRRNVGFNVIESMKGSAAESRRYYMDKAMGKDPINMVEAISFENTLNG